MNLIKDGLSRMRLQDRLAYLHPFLYWDEEPKEDEDKEREEEDEGD